ncbi:MAG: hypothetical protein JWR42_1562 [Marmoricola sp.]|nr:hypothetical protein [Marmoricola sp.]
MARQDEDVTSTLVATANVQCDLDRSAAAAALAVVLDQAPDLVGLQEWSAARSGVLRRTGRVVPVPWRGSLVADGWVWCAPLLGGCVTGARADRFRLRGCRPWVLSRPGRSDRGDQPLEPGRVATVSWWQDRVTTRTVALVSQHLVSGVQQGGRYRDDRPVLVGRHRAETRRLQLLVDRLGARGHTTYVVGDSNLHGFGLRGLTSAWEGREDHPGTLGPRRRVDDVLGPGRATDVRLVATGSDHRAVLARRDDDPATSR